MVLWITHIENKNDIGRRRNGNETTEPSIRNAIKKTSFGVLEEKYSNGVRPRLGSGQTQSLSRQRKRKRRARGKWMDSAAKDPGGKAVLRGSSILDSARERESCDESVRRPFDRRIGELCARITTIFVYALMIFD